MKLFTGILMALIGAFIIGIINPSPAWDTPLCFLMTGVALGLHKLAWRRLEAAE